MAGRVAKPLCEKYDIKAADFIEIPDVVEISGDGFAIPAMDIGWNAHLRVFLVAFVGFW